MTSAAPVLRVTAAILGGGRALRLGGVDKLLVEIGGQTQLRRLIDRLLPQSDGRILISNQPAAAYAPFDIPVLPDAWPGSIGPLAGVYTALRYAAGEGEVLCVPADAAWLPPDLAARLGAARREASAAAACVYDGAGLQPPCCLLDAALADSARAALEAGERAVHRWLESCGAARADFSHWPRWAWSYNSAEELRDVQNRIHDETS